MAGHFTALTQQSVPTDNLGNPSGGSHEITETIQRQLGVIGVYHRTLIVIPLCACVDPTVRITGMTSPERPSGTTALI